MMRGMNPLYPNIPTYSVQVHEYPERRMYSVIFSQPGAPDFATLGCITDPACIGNIIERFESKRA